jgi:hypothetical protein
VLLVFLDYDQLGREFRRYGSEILVVLVAAIARVTEQQRHAASRPTQ